MTDELERALWIESPPRKADTPEKRVEEALQKALDATTPECAGAPWEVEEKEQHDGIRIPESGEE